MSNYILFLFEGEKTEEIIFSSIRENTSYLNLESIIVSVYCTHIYQLYQKIKQDQYLDLFQLVKEMPKNQDHLSQISRDEVSQIYLFFDYDGHARNPSDDDLNTILKHFNNETESGKLYISYPMVEALRHIKSEVNFKDTTAISEKGYKKISRENCDEEYLSFKKLNQEQWNILVTLHCKKLNYLITNNFELPQQYISQLEIFNNQLSKHIQPNNTVSVLSAFPVFLIDFYGCKNLFSNYSESQY